MSRGKQKILWLTLALIGLLSGCSDDRIIVVTVSDPARIADRAEKLQVQSSDLKVLRTLEMDNNRFPVSMAMFHEQPEHPTIWFEALGPSGTVLGRAQIQLDFSVNSPPPQTVVLASPCESTTSSITTNANNPCDDGLFCNGIERCNGRICESGVPPCPPVGASCASVACLEADDACLDDGNDCTIDACTDQGEPLRFKRNDGESCLLSDLTSAEAECLGGQCVPIRPEDPVFLMRDPTTDSQTIALDSTVEVVLLNNNSSYADFHLSETATSAPHADDPAWEKTVPGRFRLSAGNGPKTVYMWVRDEFKSVNRGASHATILLSDRIWRVGFSKLGCPEQTGGPCTVIKEGGVSAIQNAVDRAKPGDAIWLYPPPAVAHYLGPVVVSTPRLTIEGAPSTQPEDVPIMPGPPPPGRRPPVFQLVANETTLRGFSVKIATADLRKSHSAISADTDILSTTVGWSEGHVLERLRLEAEGHPLDARTRQGPAILPGRGSIVRNNWIYGWWEHAVDVSGDKGGTIENTQIVHNTVILTERRASIDAKDSIDVQIQNNVFVNLTQGTGIFVEGENSIGLLVQNNLMHGLDTTVSGANVSTPGNQLQDPKLVHMRNPHPSTGSPSLNAALADSNKGDRDYAGNPRRHGPASDIGAIELVGPAPPALQDPIHVGIEATGCPRSENEANGPCDFYEGRSPGALGRAVQAAPTGARIYMHGDGRAIARYVEGDTIIDRTVTISRAPRTAEGLVEIHRRSAAVSYGLLRIVQADQVHIHGITFVCFRCTTAVSSHLGLGGLPDSDLAAVDGLIESCFITQDPSNNPVANDVGYALGHGGTLRSSIAHGFFRALLVTSARGARAINNTFFHPFHPNVSLTANAGGFLLHGATDFVAANNLIVFSDRLTPSEAFVPALGNADTIGEIFVANQFYGFDDLETEHIDIHTKRRGGTNCAGTLVQNQPEDLCAAADPGFVSRDDKNLRLLIDSPARDAGDDAWIRPGETDFDGNARSQGARVDVGAFEHSP